MTFPLSAFTEYANDDFHWWQWAVHDKDNHMQHIYSHSTIEMRSVLIDETIKLLGFDNLKIQKQHAIISGKIGNYSVHLGSGVKKPGTVWKNLKDMVIL